MELSVVIVTYNSEKYLENCLNSLYRHTVHRPIEVIVVDNASRDETLDMLGRDFPEVRVIACRENLGFSVGNNLAMREAEGRFFLLLNADTLVTLGAVDTMLRIMKERPDIGVLGPLLRNGDRSVQISYGKMIDLHTELIQKLLISSLQQRQPAVSSLCGESEQERGVSRLGEWSLHDAAKGHARENRASGREVLHVYGRGRPLPESEDVRVSGLLHSRRGDSAPWRQVDGDQSLEGRSRV